MSGTVSGPMFWGSSMGPWTSTRGKEGGHYNTYSCSDDKGMEALRELFPTGAGDALNFALFSTSGVHGHYGTIEEVETAVEDEDGDKLETVTFLVVHPRLVGTRYGNCMPKNADDFAFLKRLRETSWQAVATIGAPKP